MPSGPPSCFSRPAITYGSVSCFSVHCIRFIRWIAVGDRTWVSSVLQQPATAFISLTDHKDCPSKTMLEMYVGNHRSWWLSYRMVGISSSLSCCVGFNKSSWHGNPNPYLVEFRTVGMIYNKLTPYGMVPLYFYICMTMFRHILGLKGSIYRGWPPWIVSN